MWKTGGGSGKALLSGPRETAIWGEEQNHQLPSAHSLSLRRRNHGVRQVILLSLVGTALFHTDAQIHTKCPVRSSITRRW